MEKSRFHFARNAVIAIGSIVTATILRAVIDAVLHEPIHYTTFYLAVMVSALYGGLYWGLASTLLSAIAATFWLPPLGQPLISETSDLAEMSLFLIVSALIAWMSDRMRQQQRRAEQAAEERHRLLIAEQAARHEAERLNHAKDNFLAAVSHELRTPLQSILGWAQLLREYDMDAEETSLATASIERSVKVQNQLINDLMDLSRIVMGKLRLDPKPVSLIDVVRAAAQTVHPAAQAKNVNVIIESHAPGDVLGDADRLQQVVWNLLSNAIKFTPAGGTVRAVVSQLDDSVQLVVSDTGEGIDADFLPKVFERFRQADGSHRREGLGLGLAIVKELVELHGGAIRVSSAGKGQGTEFRTTLPKHVPAAFADDVDLQSDLDAQADSPVGQRRLAATENADEAAAELVRSRRSRRQNRSPDETESTISRRPR
jgi:signal transduction histidine kinase